MMPRSLKQLALGIDAGGTQTRWALLTLDNERVTTGQATGMSGMQMHTDVGRATVLARLAGIANQLEPFLQEAKIGAIVAGVTGVGAGNPELVELLGRTFSVESNFVSVVSDIEIAYHAALSPGEGYLVYAGTGSIAAYIDSGNKLHRAGGRGVQLDDAGGGYWIAREALRRIWRREDESPGAWHDSPLARILFEEVGGDSSIYSSRFLTERDRGEVGLLARHVASCAETDSLASALLTDAGTELARLAKAMQHRFGKRKIVVSGRAAQLHSSIETALRRHVTSGASIEFRNLDSHGAAARLAVQRMPPTM